MSRRLFCHSVGVRQECLMSCYAQNFFYNVELFQPNWETPHFRSTRALAESMKASVEFIEFTHLYTHSQKPFALIMSHHTALWMEMYNKISPCFFIFCRYFTNWNTTRPSLEATPQSTTRPCCCMSGRSKMKSVMWVSEWLRSPLILASVMWSNKPWFSYLFLCNYLPKT